MAQLRFFDADRRLAQLSAKGDPLEAIDKRFQITLGTRNRKILEQVSAGVHDGDHHACKRFPKQNSRCHCHERDRIDADPALGKISNDRKAEYGPKTPVPAATGRCGRENRGSRSPRDPASLAGVPVLPYPPMQPRCG